ncbi:hypothetical protein BGZ95_011115 [Linnemannia exigua]|uniref:F-box domain-containing protein n=1 Tax=Linnemannia exigua TaxID=604196 RepID=A0AAD4H5W3_9FUNG|nr:hypothetical protein BGZ95_011115 [Linnemannia exigua]
MHIIEEHTHPLDVPEIRINIASFLSRKDCTSCMRVNTAWFKDFARSVWHTIDFDEDDCFTKIPPKTFDKYGNLVREARNVVKEGQITTLRHSAINSLLKLEFNITNDLLARALFFDVFRQNRVTLTSLDLSAHLIDPDTYSTQRQLGIFYLTIDLPDTGSNLTEISLGSLCITRTNFSDILRYSPRLDRVSVFGNLFQSHDHTSEFFQHQGVKTLSAPLRQAWAPDNLLSDTPSLFVHFPRLETWLSLDHEILNPPVKMNVLRDELAHYCPRLVNVDFDYHETDSEDVAGFLVGAFIGLESCSFDYKNLEAISLVGILEHQETLMKIELTVPDDATRPSEADSNPSAKNLVLLILRSCRYLEFFTAEGHQMDIVAAEEHEWVCDGLRELRVRFLGLETEATVDECLEYMCALRNKGFQVTLGESGNGNGSIAHNVCRKLLPMRKLKTVWLGTKDYYLAT